MVQSPAQPQTWRTKFAISLPPSLSAFAWHGHDASWTLRRHPLDAAARRVEAPLLDQIVAVEIGRAG